MSNHRLLHSSRLFVLALALVAARGAWATDYFWTGNGEASNPRSWNVAYNWTPAGIPGPDDTATIGGDLGYSIDAPAVRVRGLALGNTVTISSGTIAIASSTSGQGTFNWTGGTLNCTVNIASDSVLNLSGSGPKSLDAGGVINNAGTVVWTGTGALGGAGNAIINNAGTFIAQSDASLGYSVNGGSYSATFNNNGTFRKKGGSGVTRFSSWGFVNRGITDIQTGTLELATGGDLSHLLHSGGRFTGAGRTRFIAQPGEGSTSVLIDGPVTLDPGSTVELSSGSVLSGSGGFTGTGTFNWTGGVLLGNFGGDSITIGTGVHLLISGADPKYLDQGAILHNLGLALWNGTGMIEVSGSQIDNRGTFSIESDSLLTYNQTGTFVNSGTLFKQNSGGTTTFQVELKNSGLVDLKSGVLLFDQARNFTFKQTSGTLGLEGGKLTAYEAQAGRQRQSIFISGGLLGGFGTIDADVSNTAVVSPGIPNAPGILTIAGDYSQGATGELDVELGGDAPGTGFDQLVVGGTATLDGKLVVRLINGFVPKKGQLFQVISYGTNLGAFASLTNPSDATLSPDYTTGTLTLGVSSAREGGCAAMPGGASAWLAMLVLLGVGVARRAR